jgi:hypothetical protein
VIRLSKHSENKYFSETNIFQKETFPNMRDTEKYILSFPESVYQILYDLVSTMPPEIIRIVIDYYHMDFTKDPSKSTRIPIGYHTGIKMLTIPGREDSLISFGGKDVRKWILKKNDGTNEKKSGLNTEDKESTNEKKNTEYKESPNTKKKKSKSDNGTIIADGIIVLEKTIDGFELLSSFSILTRGKDGIDVYDVSTDEWKYVTSVCKDRAICLERIPHEYPCFVYGMFGKLRQISFTPNDIVENTDRENKLVESTNKLIGSNNKLIESTNRENTSQDKISTKTQDKISTKTQEFNIQIKDICLERLFVYQVLSLSNGLFLTVERRRITLWDINKHDFWINSRELSRTILNVEKIDDLSFIVCLETTCLETLCLYSPLDIWKVTTVTTNFYTYPSRDSCVKKVEGNYIERSDIKRNDMEGANSMCNFDNTITFLEPVSSIYDTKSDDSYTDIRYSVYLYPWNKLMFKDNEYDCVFVSNNSDIGKVVESTSFKTWTCPSCFKMNWVSDYLCNRCNKTLQKSEEYYVNEDYGEIIIWN